MHQRDWEKTEKLSNGELYKGEGSPSRCSITNPVQEAMSRGARISMLTVPMMISLTNRQPEKGAWNAVVNPAAAPQPTSSRSRGMDTCRCCPTVDAIRAEDWMIGPSLPMAAPEAMLHAAEKTFRAEARNLISPFPMDMASMYSVACPGILFFRNSRMQPATRPPATGINMRHSGSTREKVPTRESDQMPVSIHWITSTIHSKNRDMQEPTMPTSTAHT